MRRLLTFCFAALFAWTLTEGAVSAQGVTVVTVFAAASLQDALNAAGAAFTAKTQVPVRFSFAASSALAKQIEQGAPADIFASADIDWMDYLTKKDAIDTKTRVDLLGNDLVLVAPKTTAANSVELTKEGLTAALASGRLATGAVDSVPVGRYAKTALTKTGLWDIVEPKLAQTDNVRAALALVSRGEVPLGIVYGTDAKADAGVKVVATFPDDSHPPVVYPFALTKTAKGAEPGQFLTFLQGPDAGKIFADKGFGKPAAATTH
jgi:molybdate transport system substrate-binding protein